MKYFILTYGCQMNKSDSERISAYLEQKNYEPAKSEKQADLIIINMCSVRQSAVNRVYDKISKLKTQNSKLQLKAKSFNKINIILTGCVLERDKKKFKDLGVEIKKFGQLPIKKKNQIKTAYVPIMRGCNNFCSYCVVPYTRGREKSRPVKEIIREVRALVQQGHRKIMLLGQNVNSYKCKVQSAKLKKENKKITDFVDLLKVISQLPGNFKIGFLTNHPKDMSDELIDEIARNKKIIKEIHLPIQSGDNAILKKMNRKYTREDYLKLVEKIKDKIPNVQLTTDVIVGFPGETKKAFENTVDLFKKAGFSNAYIAKYSPRPGTAAYSLRDDISHQEKKERWQQLREFL